ncbi:LCP family protein [Robertmurraya kyonggiensis]|uniref:LytR family transcriptional regulator n=1 Tax=Robertmurraya kyonggiensis TaxID=1037680 RepID=A0A4U1D3P2_9BACI|nr:LCP family protein [Robertmurraya kyonggiensis]TKC17015.1 LytR family transcriptional regulator [Robertmurraya kyonggiensis]
MSNSRIRNKSEKIRKRRRRVRWVVFPILIILISGIAYGASLLNKAESVMNDSYTPIERESARETKVDPLEENFSILFVGVDDSEVRDFNSTSRSDALMVATFNKKAKSVKLLSIPRDSYVYVPTLEKEDKITHAHANGGVKSTIETVEGLLDIPIDYYVKMNFNAFIDVIDTLGGIEVEVPYSFSEKDSKDKHDAVHLEEGLQELDGEEALALARTRYHDNDIERGKRQQQIIKAIMKKAISVKAITKIDDVMEAVGDNMATDISFDDMKAFLNYASAGTNLDIETLTLAGSDDYAGPMYIYSLDEEALEETILELKVHLALAEQSELDNLTSSDEDDVDENNSND